MACPDPAEASFFAELQLLLSRRRAALSGRVRRVCAVDAAYRGDSVAAVATLYGDGVKEDASIYRGTCTFPYVAGLFYLREGPFAVAAVRGLRSIPDVVCFDAHGSAHPRSMGLATVCGMALGIPSLGIAKSLLVGEVTEGRGSLETIVHGGRRVGFVTRSGKARYWSPGFSVSAADVESLILKHGLICLRAMAESDRLARGEIRSWKS